MKMDSWRKRRKKASGYKKEKDEAHKCLKNTRYKMFRSAREFRTDQSKYNDAALGETTS